jgi:hypothetical protein
MARLNWPLIAAALLTCAHAGAGTITVEGTLAFANGVENPLLATYDHSTALGSSRSIADVLAGHVGAFTSVAPGGSSPGGIAFVEIGLSFQDMTADDFLLVDLSLHGTFTPGSGGEADFYVDNGDFVQNAGSMSCNSYNVQYHGMPCYPATSMQVVVPLDNVDELFLTWQLQANIGVASGTADFYNSFDFSIIVPDGTTIVNNPGGSLFTTAPTASVPEPRAGGLMCVGLLACFMVAGRRRFAT